MTGLSELISSRWVEILTFLMVLGRTSGLMISAPFWGGKVVPVMVRVVVAVSLSIAVYPLVQTASLFAREGSGEPSLVFVMIALGGEILVGLALGWAAQILFAGMRLAGREIGMKMGFAMAQLVDPQNGGQTSIIGVLLDLIAALIFFSVNGHLILVQALASSYSMFPLGGEKQELSRMMLEAAGGIFTVAVRVSAPVIVGLLLSNIIMGIMSRAVPQMNVFLVAIPLNVFFGMFLFVISLPMLVSFIVDQISTIGYQLSTLSQTLSAAGIGSGGN